MEQLRELTAEERKRAYAEVFCEAFPKSELKPLSAMERDITTGRYRMLGLFRGSRAVCYLSCWQDEDYVLIDYLCVPKELRCGGIGSDALKLVMSQYAEDTVFIIETEAETGDPARDEMILRRQGLYRRLGGRFMPYDCALFGVRYRTVIWAKQNVDADEVQRRHASFYRRSMPEEIFRAAVQIPLYPGEAVRQLRDWPEH